jgi:hypothetical protein
MSLITYPNSNMPKSSSHAPAKRKADAIRVPGIGTRLRKALAAFGGVCVSVFDAIAEARLQKAIIEAELYRERYLHTSKNDDDLPIVR